MRRADGNFSASFSPSRLWARDWVMSIKIWIGSKGSRPRSMTCSERVLRFRRCWLVLAASALWLELALPATLVKLLDSDDDQEHYAIALFRLA